MMAPLNFLQQQVSNVCACDYMSKCFGRYEYPLIVTQIVYISIRKLSETTAHEQCSLSHVKTVPIISSTWIE